MSNEHHDTQQLCSIGYSQLNLHWNFFTIINAEILMQFQFLEQQPYALMHWLRKGSEQGCKEGQRIPWHRMHGWQTQHLKMHIDSKKILFSVLQCVNGENTTLLTLSLKRTSIKSHWCLALGHYLVVRGSAGHSKSDTKPARKPGVSFNISPCARHTPISSASFCQGHLSSRSLFRDSIGAACKSNIFNNRAWNLHYKLVLVWSKH